MVSNAQSCKRYRRVKKALAELNHAIRESRRNSNPIDSAAPATASQPVDATDAVTTRGAARTAATLPAIPEGSRSPAVFRSPEISELIAEVRSVKHKVGSVIKHEFRSLKDEMNERAARAEVMASRLDAKLDELIAAVGRMQECITELHQCIVFSRPPEVAQTYQRFNDTFGDCLPLQSNELLVEFDGTLSSNENYQLPVQYLLRTCGGQSIKEFISHSMKKLLANSVAVQYSGQGKRGQKKNFSGLRLYKAIVCATLEKYQGHAEKEVMTAVGHFLIGARDRGEERKARAAAARAATTQADTPQQ